MLPTLARRTAQQGIPYVLTNPYRAKRLWPPDFAKLPPKHQFRLERRYKRRAKLKFARPRWTKAVRLAQLSSIVFVAVYGVLFMEWNLDTSENGEQPFSGVRNWFWGMMRSVWTKDRVQRQDSGNAIPVTNTSR
ncbi:hypothetical protein OIDMADRAFT_119119 [Oidiodendron maius Zn]|uniref:Uncharacterized protein n=1 Tax=Oidiodendron maius (strain Zn) TaxID=913774 RepID=A0A0C3DKX6_OIDMZ|nr:hypothetical protein OIDMADRAFT_119119 [Oidiodendron maius Zn]